MHVCGVLGSFRSSPASQPQPASQPAVDFLASTVGCLALLLVAVAELWCDAELWHCGVGWALMARDGQPAERVEMAEWTVEWRDGRAWRRLSF